MMNQNTLLIRTICGNTDRYCGQTATRNGSSATTRFMASATPLCRNKWSSSKQSSSSYANVISSSLHSFPSSLTDTKNDSSWSTWYSLMKQLGFRQPMDHNHIKAALPKTLREAMDDSTNKDQAIVVTTATAPFHIVHVNLAWEEMCGYTKEEVVDQTLQCIQGKDTNTELVTFHANQLSNATTPEESYRDLYLINYKKDGTAFTNHLTMGAMAINNDIHYSVDHDNKPFLLVGVLQEIDPTNVPLRMIS